MSVERVVRIGAAITTGLALIILVAVVVLAVIPDTSGTPIILPSPTPYPSGWEYTP